MVAVVADVVVVIGTSGAVVAASRVVRTLFEARVTMQAAVQRNKVEITRIARSSTDDDEALTRLISALQETPNAVIITGDLAVVKDTEKGAPHIVVKHLSPGQRQKIEAKQAPINDASAFHAWLDDPNIASS